jgi:cytosine/adenosine deaminase-related metal-dependent hydrolase
MAVPLALHVSQSVNEFMEMTQRYGRTPIEWLRDIGFLGPRCILGHCIIVGGGSWANYDADDVCILADSGAAVAHAVWVFARRGIAMESFSRYLRRGVTMTLGTDTCPQNMIEALRYAVVISKIVDRSTEKATAADVFNAATLGGAKALNRDDLGRIAPGAKADLLIWETETLNMSPMRDPVKNIVFNAAMEDLGTVIIDGRVVVEGGTPRYAKDQREAARALQAAGERMWRQFPEHEWQHRSVDQMSPQTFPGWNGG